MDPEVVAKVKLVLCEVRNGDVELMSPLVGKLLAYLLDTLAVREVPKDLPQTAEEWMTAANEAFEDDLPAPFEARLKRWTAGHSVPGFSSSPFPKTGIGGLGGGTTPGVGPYTLIAAELETTPSAIEDDFDKLSITAHTKEKAMADMKAHGMIASRIYALALSIETGRVHPASELVGMIYGGDVRATDLVKAVRKAKIPMLSTALEAKSVPSVVTHINGLLRDLSAHHCMHEAALLSGWMQEWTQMFAGDDKTAIAYLVEYFRVYAGRGLPTPFDLSIMFRVQKNSGGGSAELAELAKDVKSLKGAVSTLQDQCAAHKKKLEEANKSIVALRRPNAAGGGGRTCFICGSKDHIAKNCPERKAEEEE